MSRFFCFIFYFCFTLNSLFGQTYGSPKYYLIDSLDLESIHALNIGLIKFKGSILFTSSDQQFVNSIATRLIEVTPKGLFDKTIQYDDYVRDYELQQ